MPDERAQTTFDFAVGITLFLLVVGFAFTTVPGFLAPYQGGGETESLVADRTADYLATEKLAAGERYRLTDDSVGTFFDSDTDLGDALGVDTARYGVWVTLNGTASEFTNRSVRTAPPGPDATLSRSRRVVSYEGDDADLTVRVWS